ncbi:hypothetical protein FIBSPDRAFT_976110, partial [Athelia psychrophila]
YVAVVFLSLVLFGIIISQVFTYFRNCDKDRPWLKLFVFVVFVLDTLSSILAMVWMYWLLIDNCGQIETFTYGSWLLAANLMVVGIVACMVQCFFARRTQIIAGKKWLTMFIVLCAFATMCGGIGTGIAVLWFRSYALLANLTKQLAIIWLIWLISAAVGDTVIAISLTYHLRHYKGRFEATNKVLDRIIRLTVQNGLLTSLGAIASICLTLSTPIPYHITYSFLMPKLYSIAVLSSLNARKHLNRDMTTTVDCGSRSVMRVSGVNASIPAQPLLTDLDSGRRCRRSH